MSMALGCLAHLVALAALTVGLERTFGAEVAAPLRPWTSLLAASLLVLGVSNALHLVRGYGQGEQSRASILARAATGEPPREGGPMMVTGVARPDSGAPLSSPLTHAPCVAYEYRLYQRLRFGFGHRRHTRVVWLGLATQPFLVDTGSRAVRVLAQPELIDTHVDLPRSEAVRANATGWVRDTRFSPFSETSLAPVFSAMVAAHTQAHPRGLRLDWGRLETTQNPADLRMDEAVLPIGERISVVGHWSPELQALVPGPGGLAGSRVTAATGEPSRLGGRATALPSSAWAVAVFGVLMFVAGVALVWAIDAGLLAAIPAALR